MPKLRVHPVGRKLIAFTWGDLTNHPLPLAFRFGKLAGAFGLRGFSLWYRDYSGPCHDSICNEAGFYQLRLNRSLCNKHCNDWRKIHGYDA